MAKPATLDELAAAGFYDPDAPDAEARRALLEFLIGIGATLDDFRFLGPDELPVVGMLVSVWPERDFQTLPEVAARAGVGTETVRRVWRAAGFPAVDDDEIAFFSANHEIFGALAVANEFFGEEATLQLVRVLGAAAARIADAAVSLFVVNVGPEAIERDPSLLELARVNFESTALLSSLVDAFDVLVRYHIFAARRPNAAMSQGVDVVNLSVGFVDLVGSTALSATLSPQELSSVFAEFDALTSDTVAAAGGRVVKLIGDEVMFTASEPAVAVDIALGLVDAFEAHAVLPSARAGVATGDVVARGGDVSGPVVNLAARAVQIARPASVLVDSATRDAVNGDGFELKRAGSYALKGFAERVPLFRARWELSR